MVTRASATTAVLPPQFTVPDGTVSVVLADFEARGYQDWELSGNCWGSGPEGLPFAGRTLTGWADVHFATTAHPRAPGLDAPSGTGRALSAPFTIPADATVLGFRIAGGHHPEHCCLNLLVGGKVVRTATGESLYRFERTTWKLTNLRGQQARLEIRDDIAAGANAFIHVDDIVLLRLPPPQPAAVSRKPKAPLTVLHAR